LYSLHRSKKYFFLLVVIPFLCVAQPKIKIVDESYFNFGTFYEGYHPSKEIRITNIGNAPLLIHDVSSTCSCSKFVLSKYILLPCDTAILNIKFISDGKAGLSERNISIMSNDSTQNVSSIRFSANVLSILLVEPNFLNIIQNKDGSNPLPNRILIKNSDSTSIHITKIFDPQSIIRTDFQEKILKPGERLTVNLTTNPVGEVVRDGAIEIHTLSEKQPVLTLYYAIKSTK
jgi:hypothetical protein